MNVVVKRKLCHFPLSALTIALTLGIPVSAAEGFNQRQPGPRPSEAVHGGIGLIQVPTARMAEAGNLTMGYSDNDEYRFWTVSLTLFPWMESTVRYADIRNRLYSPFPGFSGDQTYKDKGIDVKFRLKQESYWWPEVAVGFRDFGGTGTFESEFIAASKRFGDVDVHLGMGWGYLGAAGNTRNPLCDLHDSFCQRPSGFSGMGGQIDYQRFFKGPASIYGGIEYQTPFQPLRLKLEYEGNDYSRDRAGIDIVQDSRWNAAMLYKWGNFDFNLNYQRGNTLGFAVNYALNLHTISQIKLDPALRQVPEQHDISMETIARANLSRALLREAGFVVREIELTEVDVTIVGNQMAYRDQDVAVERISRVLAAELPRHIAEYRIVDLEGNLPMVETVVNAEDFIAAVTYQSLESEVTSTYRRMNPVSSGIWTDKELRGGAFAQYQDDR